jgi:hypothetical protein
VLGHRAGLDRAGAELAPGREHGPEVALVALITVSQVPATGNPLAVS